MPGFTLFHSRQALHSEDSMSSSASEEYTAKRFCSYGVTDEQEFIKLFLCLIIRANLPLRVAECSDFQGVFKNVNGARNVSRSVLQRELDELLEKSVSSLKMQIVQHIGRFALKVEGWNSGSDHVCFALTLHCIEDVFLHKSYTIGFEVLRKSVTSIGNAVFDRIDKVFGTYRIDDRIISITSAGSVPITDFVDRYSGDVSDNNINIGLGFVGFVRCIEKVFNLAAITLRFTFFRKSASSSFNDIINEMEKEDPAFEDIRQRMKALSKNVRDFVRGTHRNIILNERLSELAHKRVLAKNLQKGPKTHMYNTEPRWLRTYDMIKWFLYFRPEITKVLEEGKEKGELDQSKLPTLRFSDDEWATLAEIRGILLLFKEPTLSFGDPKNATVAHIIPFVYVCLQELDEVLARTDSSGDGLDVRNPLIARGIREAKKTILDCYPLSQTTIKPLQTFYLATVLDPRFKLGVFVALKFPPSVIEEVKKYFYEVYDSYKTKYEKSIHDSEDSSEASQTDENGQPQEVDRFKEIFVWQSLLPDANEADSYLSEKRKGSKCSLAGYYFNRRFNFPIIYRMAKDYLAIPAIATPTLELVSLGDAVSRKQDRLLPDAARKYGIIKLQNAHKYGQPESESSRYVEEEMSSECDELPLLPLDDVMELDEEES